jgi:hypothetical protein
MKHKKMTMSEWEKSKEDEKIDREHGYKEGSAEDKKLDEKELGKYNAKHKKAHKIACKVCGKAHKTAAHKKHKGLKLNPPSKGHTPKGAHGRAAVHALGRTKTTGGFKKIEAEKGRGAAIGAYQNVLARHQGRPAPYGGKKSKSSGREMLHNAMKHLKR